MPSQFPSEITSSWYAIFSLLFLVLAIVLYRRYGPPSGIYGRGCRELKSCDFRAEGFMINPDVYYRYGVAEMQGKRPYMEDRHVAVGKLNGDETSCLYGVFDGHGGAGASQFCVDRLYRYLEQDAQLKTDPGKALSRTFLKTDAEYLKLAQKGQMDDGTTAIAVLVNGDQIFVANAGDSRAVLVRCGGRAIPLSEDHKPNRPDEKKRITELGGTVIFWGVWRVEGVLAVSRAIGDRLLKDYVTAEPDLKEWRRTEEDEYIIIASDGVWDTVDNDDAAQIVLRAKDPQEGARSLMEEAYFRGSADNICVVVIDLKNKNSFSKTNNSGRRSQKPSLPSADSVERSRKKQ